ncbi:hypothetical protein B5M09_002429 [Aphanomyces astaci]|uniref:DNA damage-binding protein 1 n=2 Tax=Aphanomyces astaci TaxID=112090 RepID=A0A425DEL1_APHAT|nr:hypothetical protein B5M09_002429 [Aphanomyces astaci]
MDDCKNYVVTAQKPTSVTHSCVGNFTGSGDTNLILGKGTRVEIHLLTAEGLTPLHDVAIYGRITILELFRPPSSSVDLLFLCTQRYQFCVLEYNKATKTVVTKAHGNIRDSVGRMSEVITGGNIDPEGRLLGMNLYEGTDRPILVIFITCLLTIRLFTGYFKVIPMDGHGKLSDTFNIRLDELRVIDVKFLYGCSKPTICVLYEDHRAARHVKTYVILTKEKEFADGPWSQSHVEAGASLLIPVPTPFGGVLIVSQQMIVYHNGSTCHAIPMQSTVIQVYGQVDGSRFLLADQFGLLQVVVLQHTGKDVTGLSLDVLGETSIASTLSYLDNGVLFVGSAFGDSQLVKLHPSRDVSTGTYLEVLDSYVNVGPIVDFVVMDLDRQGQGQVVTCSGAYKDGSLRIVRNGIGINELAAAELPGIKGMWPLRPTFASQQDTLLVQSFVNEVRVLGFATSDNDEVELAEQDVPGLANTKTLICRNVVGDLWLQVTEHQVGLVSAATLQRVASWSPPSAQRITVAAANPTQVVVALSGGVLVYFDISNVVLSTTLVATAQTKLPHEIACLDITPLVDSKPAAADDDAHWETRARSTTRCVVGLWSDLSVSIYRLPDLRLDTTVLLGGDVLPRSLLSIRFDDQPYVLVGMGDGSLYTYALDTAGGATSSSLTNKKKFSLGAQPILLSAFRSKDVMHVFAASDRPTVLYSQHGKLLFSNQVNVMCSFNSVALPDCLALASAEDLTIGTIDNIQKLHVQTVPLNEWPRRLAHDPTSHTLAVCTVKYSMDAAAASDATSSVDEMEVSFVRLVDDQSFDTLFSYRLDPFESACSIVHLTFDGHPYYVVGTAYVHEEENEPHQGRILVLSVVQAKLVLVAEKEVKGAVYCLNAFQGKLLAGINSKTTLFKWSDNAEDADKELVAECGHHGHTLVLYMESRGDFIAIGDLMKSISLLQYKALDGSLEEVAKDLNSNWMAAVDILDDDHFIGSETDFNLFCVERQSGATTDEERSRLDCVSEYHVGEFVNRFRHGSLVMQEQGQATTRTPLLFGTVSGMIGCILPLDNAQYGFLRRVESALNQVIKGVGGLLHKEWRMYESKRTVNEARGFVDGDLIEGFLDLTKPHQQKAVDLLNVDGAMDGRPPVTPVDEDGPSSYLRKSIDVEDIDVPISNDDLMRSLDAELDKRRPDTYIITQLCRDLGEIPTQWRARVWKELLCPGGIKAELPVVSPTEQDDPNQRVIRADAPRTRAKDFPADSREAVERTLVHMLTYYCKCKNIRYKQGMNEVLAPFLLLRGISSMSSSSSGWTDAVVYQCFYSFIDKFLTNVFSDREFRSLQCSMRLLRLLLQYHDPVLCAHLDQHDMTPELYVTSWFMTFFTRHESPDLVFALWDTVLLADDPILLHFFALALLEDSRDRVMQADVAEMPQVLARLTFTSVAHVHKLTAVAQDRLANTPASFRKDVLLVCYRPLTDRSLPALRHMGAAPCLSLHAQEVAAHMVSKIQTNKTSPNGFTLLVLDCRPFAAFQEFHFTLSYHIDPDVLASPEAFNVLLDGFGRMKDCHFCFLGDQASPQRGSPDDPPTSSNSSSPPPATPPATSSSNDRSTESDMHVTRFVLLFLQHGFPHVSRVQGGVDALRAEVAAHADAELVDQLTVGEWSGPDDPYSLKSKAKKLLLGKLPTLTQRFRGAMKPFAKKAPSLLEGDTTQGPLVDEDEWVEVVVRSKEVLKRTSSSSSSPSIAPTKQVLFGSGKLGILFKGIDKSPITVDSVVPKGQADLTNQIERGDVLVAVAGQSVHGMKFHHVMDMLHAAARPMTLEFSHPSSRLLDVLDALSVSPHAPTMLRNGPYSLSLLWDTVPGATRYQLQFAMQSEHRFHPWATVAVKNRSGVGLLDHIAAPAVSAGTLVGLEPNEKYLVRLRCGTDSTWGVYSEASAVLSTLPLDNTPKLASPRATTTCVTSSVVFLAGECPDVVELGLFYYRVLIGLRARSGPSYEAPTVDVALDKGSLIKCEEKVTRGPFVFVRLQDTDLWAFETTVDNAAVLERLAFEDKQINNHVVPQSNKPASLPSVQPLSQQRMLMPPTGLAVQAPTTSSVVVSWEGLLDPLVVKYQVQYSKNSIFGAMWVSKDVSSQLNSCVLTQLSPGTPYVVRIRAGFETSWGPFSPKSAPVKTIEDDHPPAKSTTSGPPPTFFLNSFVERAAETAAVAARSVSARLTRTASQDLMDDTSNEMVMDDLPSLVVNVEEMKATASTEFRWFAAQKVSGDLEWTCDVVVSHGK